MKCPEYQVDFPDDALFCFRCEHEITPTTRISSINPRVEGERKRVTALFSDLSGYTSMTEEFDPEEVNEITGRIIDEVKAIISKYEGYIQHIAGDGMLAFLMYPWPMKIIRFALSIPIDRSTRLSVA